MRGMVLDRLCISSVLLCPLGECKICAGLRLMLVKFRFCSLLGRQWEIRYILCFASVSGGGAMNYALNSLGIFISCTMYVMVKHLRNVHGK